MNDHPFDQVARLLTRAGSRRRALAAFGALALARTTPASAASQIETAACGEAGAVCTEIKGCCEGLVCATSYTNPAYGVCVSGEGDMLPVSDDIVVPGAEGTEEELAQLVTGTAGSTTGGQDGLAAQPAEIEARKAARATRRSNRRSKRNTQATRRRGNHGDRHTKKLNNQDENERARDLRGAPHLKLTFFNETGTDPEKLKVQNREDVAVTISRVETIKRPGPHYNQSITIAAGETHWLYSGVGAKAKDTNDPKATAWTEVDVCPLQRGISLTAFKSGDSRTHRLTERC